MNLLNPFNGSTSPLFEIHITIQDDPFVLNILNKDLLSKLKAKLTTIMFFNLNTPPQYMITYIDNTEDITPKLQEVFKALRVIGSNIVRLKIETSYAWYQSNYDDERVEYFETHIELPIECYNIWKSSPEFMKSYNKRKPHLFSLTNRVYSKDMSSYFPWLQTKVNKLHSDCLSIPEYESFYRSNKPFIEVCILDTNPSIDDSWILNLE